MAEDYRWATSVRVADVFKQGVRAATLARTLDGVVFRYLPEYLGSGGPAVATSLPVTDQPVVHASGALPPFFSGLLPEGRRLSGLRRAVKTSADDELSLVLAVGRDPVGDVQIVPEGEIPTPAEPIVQVDRDWSEIRFADVLADADIVDPIAIPGVQDKFSAGMISTPLARRGERYVLKLDPPGYPHVVENEAFFLALAKECGLESARAEVVLDADGRPGLLVTRFDRVVTAGGEVRAVACEDACQVLGRWPADKYLVSTEEMVNAMAERCDARRVAALRCFEQVCFAWLTGNGDLHAKNLSIVAPAEGEWRISPAYDVPSTLPYGDRTLALAIRGKTDGLSRNHLLAFAADIDLPERAARSALDALLERLADLPQRLREGALPFPQKATADWVAALRFRHRQARGTGSAG